MQLTEITNQGSIYLACDKLSGKWCMPVLWSIYSGNHRFGKIFQSVYGVSCTHKSPMGFSNLLKKMIRDGLLEKITHSDLKTEYHIKDHRIIPVLEAFKTYNECLK